jgi:hypothetical protein
MLCGPADHITQIMSDKLAHDREMKDVKDALRSIAAKLDNI